MVTNNLLREETLCCHYMGYFLISSKGSFMKKKIFYLTTHLLIHYIYGYMASAIWQRTTQTARQESYCHYMGYIFQLAARDLLYALSQTEDYTYYGLYYISYGTLDGMRSSLYSGSIGFPLWLYGWSITIIIS